ncbi:MAG: uroporphyrinogen methyltransferase / synthase, partial [Chloroflexota bacterium]|nr:uroporphyrinogen methyltransferase / synthase [Chloroflexota bacterium]
TDPRPARAAAARVAAFDLLVFTSANGVRAFVAIAAAAGHPVAPDSTRTVLAVGPATAAAAEAVGLTCEPLPDRFAGAGLAEWLAARPAYRSALLPGAEVTTGAVAAQLRAGGTAVEEVAVYRTVEDPVAAEGLARALEAGVDYVAFTSPSTVRAFVASAGPAGPAAGIIVACIGPTTAAEAEAQGLTPALVADPHTADALAAAIAVHAAGAAR